jgi:hypothetical protein
LILKNGSEEIKFLYEDDKTIVSLVTIIEELLDAGILLSAKLQNYLYCFWGWLQNTLNNDALYMEIISVENWGKLEKKQLTIISELYKIGNVVVAATRFKDTRMSAGVKPCRS